MTHQPLDLCRFDTAQAVASWRAIDDRVMGGVSHSHLRFNTEGHATFEGEVSLEHNGGFASVRSGPGMSGVPGATHCVIEARGDGKLYKLCLFIVDAFDATSYQAEFSPPAHDWGVIRLPVAAFRASLRGRQVLYAPALSADSVRQVGLMIAGRQAGRFALDIRAIRLE
ncbi:MAG: CIA30 family protein [Burkholderiales bacterium]